MYSLTGSAPEYLRYMVAGHGSPFSTTGHAEACTTNLQDDLGIEGWAFEEAEISVFWAFHNPSLV